MSELGADIRCVSLTVSDSPLSVVHVRGTTVRCEDYFVIASEWTDSSSLWETLKSLCSDKAGEAPTLPPGFGVVFLEHCGGFLVRVVTRRSSL